MAGSATSQHTALTNLQAQLAARSYITTNTVAVASGAFPLGFFGARSVIELWATEADEEWALLGGRSTEETYRIHGGIYTWSPGADEAAVVAARNAAVAIYQELQAQLRSDPSINGAVRVARVQRATIDQAFDDTGRICIMEFWVDCAQRLTGN